MTKAGLPPKQGLYDPRFEHDGCGVGFVVNIKGEKSREIVEQALTVLQNLDHRGACGCEENTGDGAGILMQVPHAFLKKAAHEAGFPLPSYGEYGVGMAFLPKNPADQKECCKRLEAIVQEEGQKFLGWRTVPTNTFPSWDRAHPYRYIAHNGEINTLRGNVNWMFTRQALCQSEVFGEDLKKILPVVRMDGSDSAIFDNTLEFLVMSGRSLAHAMMMMIPEPWQNHESMTDE